MMITSHRFALLLAAFSVGYFAVRCLEYEVVQDDAYISFAYAKNLATGEGLVFNPGERVEGYTNFSWTMALAFLHWVGLDIVLMARIMGFLCATGLFAVVWWFGGLLAAAQSAATPSPGWRLPALSLLAANGAFAFWTLSGMETPAFALWITLGAGLYIRDILGGTPRWITGLVFGLAALTRPEGIFFYGLTGLHWLALQVHAEHGSLSRVTVRLRSCVPLLAPFLALVIPHFIFRLLYYGHPLPNTFYAKTGWAPTILAMGLEYTGKFLADYSLLGVGVLAPILWFVLSQRRRVAAYVSLLIYANLAYVTWIGGDTLAENRLHLPMLALMYLAVQEAARQVLTVTTRSRALTGERLTTGLAVVGLIGALMLTVLGPRAGLQHAQRANGDHNAKLFALVDFIQEHAQPESLLIASTAIGIPKYHTAARILDLVGLADEVVAHHPVPLPEILDDHRLRNYNARYAVDRSPDYIYFITGELPVTPAERALYLSRRFRQEYAFSYLPKERPILVRQAGPAGPDELFPSGTFVELYRQALALPNGTMSRELLRQSIATGPADFAEPHTWLGRQLYDAGEYEAAAVAFERALQIDDRTVQAAAHLAILRLAASQVDEAVLLGARAASLAPGSHFSLYAFGRSLRVAQRWEEAIQVLTGALQLGGPAGSTSDAAYQLGLSYRALGDEARARAAFSGALQADPSHPGARRALQRQ